MSDSGYFGIGAALAFVTVSVCLFFGFSRSSKVAEREPKEQGKPGPPKGKKEEKAFPAGKMSVYFGSQTGTAEGFARTVCDDAKKKGFEVQMVDLEEFDPAQLASARLAVFLMATYGEGEPTDNAAKFVKWLKNEDREVEDNFLSNLSFSVFGLGSTQYEHFNRTGKLVNSLLEKLGAKRVVEYGEGDDNGTMEEDYEAWKEKAIEKLVRTFHPAHQGGGASTTETEDSEDSSSVEVTFDVTHISPPASLPPSEQLASSLPTSAASRHFFTAPHVSLVTSRQLRNHSNGKNPSEVGSTLHLELDINNSGLTYRTADNLAILPENETQYVEMLAGSQGWDLHQWVEISPKSAEAAKFKYSFPNKLTIRDLLTFYLDIQGPVRLSTLQMLRPFVKDEMQKTWLNLQLAKDNRASLKSFLDKQCPSLATLLAHKGGKLSSAQLSLAEFIRVSPLIQPRYYTISSSSLTHPTQIHLTVAITQFSTLGGAVRKGLCTGYLERLSVGEKIRVFVRASTFRLPTNLATPIILIGPGTGLAPMRAFLQERSSLIQQGKGQELGSATLFFGCKKRDEDYIYHDEMDAALQSGALTNLHLAFSRDQATKIYVQHLMDKESSALLSLLEGSSSIPPAHVYVCGATSMGSDVQSTFVKVLAQGKGISNEEATNQIKKMQEQGRYVQELWSA